ncbi:hypothetical protein B7494_g1900 [Chlorociboria aeruginascens]|nr:hypothetical protein B7494_g1900 [Chlorociboria aeruginascens]
MDFNNNKNICHRTTVDAAKARYTTIDIAGHKRSYDELRGSTDATSVLADITNRSNFRRPQIRDSYYPPLKASAIQNAEDFSCAAEYSQRKNLALTPNPISKPLLELSHPSYGLPQGLIGNFSSIGIKSIYPWQSDCLLRSGALGGQNLVYSAPTGGGKSLVADILMLKTVIENPEKKALLVLPYVALVQEKLRWLRRVVDGVTKNVDVSSRREQQPSLWRKRGDEDSVRVMGIFGGSRSQFTWADTDIAICTIEKANSLVNAAIDDCSVSKLGVVVIDELHFINDEYRGYILELMATKLLSLEQNVQLIGMSATLQNAETLAKWLNNAKFYISKYRPVPIEEHLVFDNAVYPASSSSRFYKTATQLSVQSQTQARPQPCRKILPSSSKQLKNPLINSVVSLANETARAGFGALVFCSSRSGCERDASLISQVLPRIEETDRAIMEKRRDLVNDLRSTSTGLDHVLERIIPLGVAFHHAGLTIEERDLIATAYDEGVIKVIVATCSLAAGINLPARRVILHGARMGSDLIGPSMLRQMRGRAGRKGKDEIGETYLCCQKSDLEAVAELMEAEIPNVESCLLPGKRERALLEVIATKLATSVESIDDYMKKTLLYQTIDHGELADMVKFTLDELKQTGLVQEDGASTFQATLLGEAIVMSSLTPEDGLFIHRELKKALQAFVMDGEMHVLYTFTPMQAPSATVNWQVFRQEMEGLDDSDLRVLNFVGLKPQVINKMAQGASMKETTPEEIEKARIYKRFYAALQLRDLCNEMPIHAVSRKYDLPRGAVQNLSQTCHGFATGMIKFCQRMDWGALVAVLDHYSDRLKAGAKSDLLALAEVTYIKSRTARVFWDNGYKTLGAIAAAHVNDLVPILLMAQPKKLKLDSHDEQKYHEKLLKKAEVISQSANRIWERQIQVEIDEE